MEAGPTPSTGQRFATRILPWIVGVGALLLYGLTLNPWISLHSMPVVARTCGWEWQPQFQHPLTFLVLWPFRFLPEASIPLALNIFSALCASGVLALLVRSVALWPQDRTRPQWWREKSEFAILSTPTAWIPPLMAALALALQLTFWEHATSASGDMLDLLLFVWVIRALLEFRIDQKQSWLFAGAFLFAAGMADNWSFIPYLPAFLVAILWLKGLAFFNLRFLARMSLWAAAGLSLYLLLPLVASRSGVDHVGFWFALKANLKAQKEALSHFPVGALLALSVPLLTMSICWRGKDPEFGDDSLVGSVLTKAIFHFIHAVFLLLALWLMLDPPFSPRHVGHGSPSLAQYALVSLMIGYFIGYFLLVATVDLPKFIALPTLTLLCILLVFLPAALIWRNLGQIRTTNGPMLRDYAEQLWTALPAGHSTVLSDDSFRLNLLRGQLAAHSGSKTALLLDTRALALGGYQRFMASHFKSRWPGPATTNEFVSPFTSIKVVCALAMQSQAVYLHPSFGYCLEGLAAQPHQAVNNVAPVPRGGVVSAPRADQLAANDRYWQGLHSLESLVESPAVKPSKQFPLLDNFARCLHLEREQNPCAAFTCATYSKSLNYWGVCLQRAGQWERAGVWFQYAIKLKPENLPARLNLEFNNRHRRGETKPLDREWAQTQFLNLFTRYRNWEAAVTDCGPVDEPTFLFETGRALIARRHLRQAASEFARCAELAPTWIEPKLWLAQVRVNAHDFREALELTDEIKAAGLPPDGSGLAQFLFCRAAALQGLGRTNEAAVSVADFLNQHPGQEETLAVAATLYLRQTDAQPALEALTQLLRQQPANLGFVVNRGRAEIQLSRYDDAIATLSEALAISPTNRVALYNRAIAHAHAGHLDAAEADFGKLLGLAPNSWEALYGLTEIAVRRQDTNTVARLYERTLAAGLPAPAKRRLASLVVGFPGNSRSN